MPGNFDGFLSFVSAFLTQQPQFLDFRLNQVVAAAALPQSLRLAKTGPLFSQSHHSQEETGPQGRRGPQVRKSTNNKGK